MSKDKGLKRDLTMLLPEDITIETDPNKPYYDPRHNLPLDQAMVTSIREVGVLKSIGILSGSEGNLCMYGRQTVKHTAEANRLNAAEGLPPIRIPCVFKRADERTGFKMLVIENLHRQAPDPMWIADNIAKFEQTYGATDDEIITTFKLDNKSQLKAYRALINTAASVQKAVSDGRVKLSVAVELAKLETAQEQTTALKEMMESGAKPTVRAAKETRTGKKSAKLPSRGKMIKMATSIFTDEAPAITGVEALELIGDDKRSDFRFGFAYGVLWALGESNLSFDKLQKVFAKFNTTEGESDGE